MFAFFILGNLHDITASFVVVKFLACINVDIGIFDDIKLNVPLFWIYLWIEEIPAVVEYGFLIQWEK